MIIFGVIGWKNSGKTTLVEKLVAEAAARGLRVATVKHAHHAFDIDHPGRDSHRHRMAGAGQVIVSSGARWAHIHELRGAEEPDLKAHIARLDPCDLVLVEGYKTGDHPKIEVWRAANSKGLIMNERPDIAPTIRAIACDAKPPANAPVLDMNNAPAILDFILGQGA